MLLLSLWLITLLSLTKTESAPTYSAHICSNSTFFIANGTYQTNLNLVLSSLTSDSSNNNNNGFYNASAGDNPADDVVSGLSLCRGDVNTTICQDCVATASKDILRRCPLDKVAIIWYEECLLRYSNQSIFATINEVPQILLSSKQNITGAENDRFNDVLAKAMNSLATRAANSDSGRKFATEEDEFTSSKSLYSLGQCTPDLTESDCSRCFQSAIAALPTCCNGKQGGRVLLPSCNIRYELCPFFNITSASPIVPPLTPAGENKMSSLTILVAIAIPIAVSVVLFFIGCCFLREVEIPDVESLQFDMDTIEAATNKFSDDNKIGEGGFGAVYKGTFPNGEQIAVKRLSVRSGQGAVEFKNEVVLVFKLQHRNLVRLLGFCLEGEDKLLIYEYVPNKSLDHFLFEPAKQGELNWSKRYKIIEGIVREILYLHEDSRIRIIHHDVKASNVLLDHNVNPKISDFGMARIFVEDKTQANTNRIVGTFGYMSPEYAMHGRYSMKSDVFSFGVLVLEIISGKKNTYFFYQSELAEDLLSYAWKQWRNGTPLELLDPSMRNSYSRNEVVRCIHIGLLCIKKILQIDQQWQQ
ncbi:hypothetical protein RGQ29_019235 [Quercus rubra]|uniref:Cysteine-rich receptor-like protein kinase 10 n=1 Tax=Quercus rubra TaxID=3512 RepID=A0AAN7INF8_QUERU|nr:hypothetical protein RGQ29_019235 [Quercus rubra]